MVIFLDVLIFSIVMAYVPSLLAIIATGFAYAFISIGCLFTSSAASETVPDRQSNTTDPTSSASRWSYLS